MMLIVIYLNNLVLHFCHFVALRLDCVSQVGEIINGGEINET